MPPAAILGGAALAGTGASAAGGKKASNSANDLAKQQLQLQQQQFGLTKQQFGLGNAALGPASDYWQALLKGGPAAVQATGPYASLIGQATKGADTAISATTARGGEQNLARAMNVNQGANNVSRLYAGMQPLAAQGLTNVGGAYLGSGSSVNPMANLGGAFQNYAQQQQMAGQAGQGFGALLYNAMNKTKQGGASVNPGAGGKG